MQEGDRRPQRRFLASASSFLLRRRSFGCSPAAAPPPGRSALTRSDDDQTDLIHSRGDERRREAGPAGRGCCGKSFQNTLKPIRATAAAAAAAVPSLSRLPRRRICNHKSDYPQSCLFFPIFFLEGYGAAHARLLPRINAAKWRKSDPTQRNKRLSGTQKHFLKKKCCCVNAALARRGSALASF